MADGDAVGAHGRPCRARRSRAGGARHRQPSHRRVRDPGRGLRARRRRGRRRQRAAALASVPRCPVPGARRRASRAYFAFLERTERRALLDDRPFGRFSEQTPADLTALEAEFDNTARLGDALSEGEYDARTRALGMPVRMGARPVASVAIIEDAASQPEDDLLDHLSALEGAAAQLSGAQVTRARRAAP
ncbi:IclR family transcriptional regulator C-terminal domain-containing protein [Microbacterium sp.]|uniref:IclR family transcriptional regulator domain-containing protein n=1 Tax=Microbacterium sp. TaxID=51671 RepID=UPI0035C8453D